MSRLFQFAFAAFARVVLSLRYRVRVEGLEGIAARRGVLILPNHPAYVDPALVLSRLWPWLQPRPMLLASVFANPVLFWLPRLLRALPIPELGQHSAEARKQTEDVITAIADGLSRGENFILWPSGRVQRAGREVIGGTRSVTSILERVPDVDIVLVRTRGLRGSMFSYARTGSAPRLVACLLRGIGLLLGNLVFFAPRRRVEITVEALERSALPGETRETLNPFLEDWYDRPGPEDAVHVPYHFLFGARTFRFPEVGGANDGEHAFDGVDVATRAAVSEVLADKLGGELPDGVPADDPRTPLEAFGFDSLDTMELSLEVEDRFGFRGEDVPETVGDLWKLAAGLAGTSAGPNVPETWRRDAMRKRDGVVRIDGETILEAMLLRAAERGRDVVVADDLSGALTYERFVVAARAMARQLERRISVRNVGILLPASVATDLLVFAVHLAGKTPVMINWTTGPSNVAHAARVMGLTHVVSSRRFVDRMAIAVEGTDYLFAEDIRKSIGKLELLGLLASQRLFPRRILSRLPAATADDPAVVLFTSGSEKAPKAVPLTHRNILSNLRSVLARYDIYRNDVFLGFLPPFHSFGFTVTVMAPLLGGCRVVHHPDPTDAAALGRKLHGYGATILGATPTFLGYILKRSDPEQLASLRWAVVGGEACPDVLFDEFEKVNPNADLLEGYGVTECSPLVACTQPGVDDRGTMGLPLPDVELAIVDPESHAAIDGNHVVGMLLVAGPNVFPGYLAADGPSPFVERDGRRWYVTGDLVERDADGHYCFRGRLKRFLKAGGEMISLPAVEAPLVQRFPPGDDGPRIAVEGVDMPERQIVLFTTESISLREANAILVEAGLRGVMRLDAVREVEAIPVLGTGKIDYKVLRASLQQAAAPSGS